MKIIEVVSTRTRLYHASQREFPVGFVLSSQVESFSDWAKSFDLDLWIEQVLEYYRPNQCLPRHRSVFMLATPRFEFFQASGVYPDWIYEVSPTGQVERNDQSWMALIAMRFGGAAGRKQPTTPEVINELDLKKWATAYWAGAPYRGPKIEGMPKQTFWEYRAASAKILRNLTEQI